MSGRKDQSNTRTNDTTRGDKLEGHGERRKIKKDTEIRLNNTYLPTPPLGQDMTQRQYLSGGLNSEFSFSTNCFTKAEEPSLPYYLPLAGGRILGFIPFPRVLVLCELQCLVHGLNSCRRVHFLRR